jgi:tight adherence protein B
MIVALLGGGSVFFALLALYSFFTLRGERGEISNRISKWLSQQTVTKSWSDELVEKLDRLEMMKKLEPELEKASIPLRPAEYSLVVLLGAGIVAFALKMVLGAPTFISISLAMAAAPFGSKLFLRSRRKIYVQRINEQLSEACRLLSSAARAGLSIPQGLELVVKELPPPIKNELSIVVREVQLGRDLEGALKDLLNRVNSKDMQVFVNALIIQRRAGGDLARVLSEMARTMEERKIIHQTIQAATAQSRYSAYMLPVVSLFVVFVLSKMMEGFDQLFKHPFGIVILVIFVVLQVIGVMVVRKIADIRV